MLRRVRLIVVLALVAVAFTPASARADDVYWIPSWRGSIGPAFRFGEREGNDVGFGADIDGGFLYPFAGGRGAFTVELGYTYDDLGFDAFNASFGIGVNVLSDEESQLLYLLYQPRLLVGDFDGHTGAGMRNALSLHALYDTFTLEVGHQFVNEGVTLHHDFRFHVGLNVVAPIYLVARRFGG